MRTARTTARTSSRVDMRRLGMAVSMPGIDPACWVALATVDDDEEAFTWEPGTGWLVDVTFHWGKLDQDGPHACRVASAFSTAGELSSCPVQPGAEVLVVLPGDGDPNDTPVIVAQLSNKGSSPVPLTISSSPAPELVDEAFARATFFLVTTKDLKLQVGSAARLDASSSAGVHAPAVTLAEPTASQPFVRGTALANALSSFLDSTTTMANALSSAFTAAATASVGPLSPLAAQFTAMATAVNAWKPAIVTLKSALVPGNVLSTKIHGE